jgi:hypothetical protein
MGHRVRLIALLMSASLCAAATAPPKPSALETVSERSGFRITGRYGEVERLCLAFAQAYPQSVRCTEFGRTPEGRPMLALVISKSGALTPQDARERNVPVTLMQGGIHAGEIDGKDAGFLAVREMLTGKLAPRALESFVFVFVPVFNVDGHERFGRWNRPNQNGPEEMGWRVTSQNLNLNRDYTKADAPETQAMLRLLEAWDPVLYVDLHVTDGAQFEHDVANLLEPIYMGDTELRVAGRAALDELNQALTAQGSLPLDFYPSFLDTDNPESGFTVGAYSPRFSTGYWPLHNRFALLVETHSWKDYPTRVRTTHNTIIKLSEMTAQHGREWRKLMRAADERAQRLGGEEVALDYQPGPHTRTIDFRGYAYTRTPSEISGALVTRYDPTKPQIWRIPLRDTVIPKLTVRAPLGGYVIPPAYAALIAERLSVHGVRFDRLGKAVQGAAVESFRATAATFASASFEGRTPVTLTGEWREERRDLPAGSLFVPVSQPLSRLVLTLLEPRAPDSFAAWGLFNAAFEAKEYMEPYVAEQVAKEILASDPATATEFAKRLAQEPEFARNPAARLEFFYRRHPSWDERQNLYPVLRVKEKP